METTVGDTELILCPVMGSLIHANELSGEHGSRTSLLSMYFAFRRLGLSMAMTVLAVLPVPFLANGFWGAFRNTLSLSADLHRMGGHLFDHGADSKVLTTADGHRTVVDEGQLERFVSFPPTVSR